MSTTDEDSLKVGGHLMLCLQRSGEILQRLYHVTISRLVGYFVTLFLFFLFFFLMLGSGGFRGVRGVRPHPPWRLSEKFRVYQF